MYKFISLSLLFLFSFITNSFSNSPEEQFKIATEAFESGNHAVAVQAYETLTAQGYQSPELFYNLGTACLRNNEIAKAVLNLERAALMAPSNEEIQYNLEIAHEKTVDEIQSLKPFFLKQAWNTTRDYFSSTLWSIIALLFLWVGIGGVILWLLAEARSQKKKGFLLGLCFLGLSIVSFLVSIQRHSIETNNPLAVIMVKEIPLRIASSEDAQELFMLHAGTKVTQLSTFGAGCASDGPCWIKVKLPNGEKGWLPQAVLERI